MEATSPLISIIVPVYKVEPYLRRCIDSIVGQTYTNLEIILVDDGSPDNCPAICDEYAAKDSRIIVIHKENGGLSDARNTGLDICKGEYISFVDSDDWIADSFVEILLTQILENNADFAVCQHIKTSSIYSCHIKTFHIQSTLLSALDATKKIWFDDGITFITAWGKIAKRDLWEKIRFPKGIIHEDEYTSYKLLYKASKTVFINISLYFYYQRPDSIMAKVEPSSIRALRAQWEKFEYFRENNQPELVKLCLKTLCWDLLFAYAQAKQNKNIPTGFIDSTDLINKTREAENSLKKYNVKVPHALMLKIFSKFPILYLLCRKILPVHIRDI